MKLKKDMIDTVKITKCPLFKSGIRLDTNRSNEWYLSYWREAQRWVLHHRSGSISVNLNPSMTYAISKSPSHNYVTNNPLDEKAYSIVVNYPKMIYPHNGCLYSNNLELLLAKAILLERLEKIFLIPSGWEPHFKRIDLCWHVKGVKRHFLANRYKHVKRRKTKTFCNAKYNLSFESKICSIKLYDKELELMVKGKKSRQDPRRYTMRIEVMINQHNLLKNLGVLQKGFPLDIAHLYQCFRKIILDNLSQVYPSKIGNKKNDLDANRISKEKVWLVRHQKVEKRLIGLNRANNLEFRGLFIYYYRKKMGYDWGKIIPQKMPTAIQVF